jgi:hypothetical protein
MEHRDPDCNANTAYCKEDGFICSLRVSWLVARLVLGMVNVNERMTIDEEYATILPTTTHAAQNESAGAVLRLPASTLPMVCYPAVQMAPLRRIPEIFLYWHPVSARLQSTFERESAAQTRRHAVPGGAAAARAELSAALDAAACDAPSVLPLQHL